MYFFKVSGFSNFLFTRISSCRQSVKRKSQILEQRECYQFVRWLVYCTCDYKLIVGGGGSNIYKIGLWLQMKMMWNFYSLIL